MNFFQYIYLLIIGTEPLTKWTLLFFFVWLLISPVLKKLTGKADKKLLIRLILGAVPLVWGIAYACLNLHPATYDKFLARGGLLSLALILLSIVMFIPDGKKEKKVHISNIVKGLMTSVSFLLIGVLIYQLSFATYVTDFSHLGWADSFSSMIDAMSESYANKDWKQIDFEDLKSKYVPKAQEAEKNNDKTAFAAVLLEYQYEFFDSHIWFNNNRNIINEAEKGLIGNDYGLSMYTIASGDTIAVLVDEESKASHEGIHNGSVITAWDGVPVSEAVKDVRCLDYWYQFEVLENEELMRPIFLAGQGGDSVDVTFITDEGETKTVTLESGGEYKSRELSALTRLYSDNRITGDNFSHRMLSDNVGYLRISREHYDDVLDIVSSLTGKYGKIYDDTDKILQEMKDSGMEYLVIDLRHNAGGYSSISFGVASLFADRKLTVCDGSTRKGEYKKIVTENTFGEEKWKDLPVAVLVNDAAVSAGDILAHLFSQCPNVTVMGITSSSNSTQAIGGICYLSDDMFEIEYPNTNTAEKNGELIEVTADRQARVGFDVRIPVDRDAALKIFSDSEEDYELEYAMEYLTGAE